jgi:hypothetical protein
MPLLGQIIANGTKIENIENKANANDVMMLLSKSLPTR